MDKPDIVLHENLPLLEVADPHLLDSLLADPATARFILTRLSNRVAIIAPGQFDALQARLLKLGQLPKVRT